MGVRSAEWCYRSDELLRLLASSVRQETRIKGTARFDIISIHIPWRKGFSVNGKGDQHEVAGDGMRQGSS